MRRLYFFLLFFGLLMASAQPELAFSEFATGLARPVDLAHADDDRLFVVEQRGTIRIIDADGQVSSDFFLDIRDRVDDTEYERGLLGLVFHPDYASNGYFYVNYTGANGTTHLARFSVSASNPDQADANSEKTLLTVGQPFSNHNAGDLAFGPDGYLYAALGDGGAGGDPQAHGQDLSTLLGSILRLDVDEGDPYAIPADNPFVNEANARDEIWSYGWRNPWRISFDRQTGDMWIGDVGQGEWEEISYEAAGTPGGGNYGWRCYEGNATYNLAGCNGSGFVAPVFEYDHGAGRSVTGGYVYRGSQYPGLQGYYVLGDFATGDFWAIRPDGGGGWQSFALGTFAAFGGNDLSTFGEDQAGELYAANRDAGTIYQVQELSISGLTQTTGELRVYPQPWQDRLYITRPASAQGTLTLHLYDLQGRELLKQSFTPREKLVLSRAGLSAGLYLLTLQSQQGNWQGKVMLR